MFTIDDLEEIYNDLRDHDPHTGYAVMSAYKQFPGEGRRIAAALQAACSRHADNFSLKVFAHKNDYVNFLDVVLSSGEGHFTARAFEIHLSWHKTPPQYNAHGHWHQEALLIVTDRNRDEVFVYSIPHLAAMTAIKQAFIHAGDRALCENGHAPSVDIGGYVQIDSHADYTWETKFDYGFGVHLAEFESACAHEHTTRQIVRNWAHINPKFRVTENTLLFPDYDTEQELREFLFAAPVSQETTPAPQEESPASQDEPLAEWGA